MLKQQSTNDGPIESAEEGVMKAGGGEKASDSSRGSIQSIFFGILIAFQRERVSLLSTLQYQLGAQGSIFLG